jgi:hypothetical protein
MDRLHQRSQHQRAAAAAGGVGASSAAGLADSSDGALFAAAAEGDAAAVGRWLAGRHRRAADGPLSAAASPLPQQPDGSTPFVVAARHGQLEVLQALQAHRPDVAAGLGWARNDGVTPLLAACSQGHAATVQWVWARLPEAARRARTQTDRGALEMAASSGSAALMRWMLQHHPEVTGGSLPVATVRRLLRQACMPPPCSRAERGERALFRTPPGLAPHECSSSGGEAHVIQLLCDTCDEGIDLATARLGADGLSGPTTFAECCGRGNAEAARWLAQQPGVAAVALDSEWGGDLLQMIAAHGHAQVAGVIVDLREWAWSHAPASSAFCALLATDRAVR